MRVTKKNTKKNKVAETKASIVKAFLAFVKKHTRVPNKHDLLGTSGISSNIITTHFGGIEKLEEHCRREYPDAFAKFIDHRIFTKKNFEKLKEKLGDYSKFVVTTAITDCAVNKPFLANLKRYCKLHDALLLVIPVSDPAHSRYVRGSSPKDGEKWQLDPALAGTEILYDDWSFNSNLSFRSIKLTAKQIKPMTGLKRLAGQHGGSFIFGHPKQDMDVVPVGNKKLPHIIMTTGAVTNPSYVTSNYFSERTAYFADHDHILGALVVDVIDDDIYHVSNIQAEPKTGNFFDYGYYYESGVDGLPKLIGADGFVLGDYHAGEHDLKAKKAWKYIVGSMPIKELVVHDFFNGKSITHHERYRLVSRAIASAQGKISLEKELEVTANELNDLCSWPVDRIVIVKSNHDEWLGRYIEDGFFIQEPQNARFASQLFAPMVDGHDPLRFALENLDELSSIARSTDIKLDAPEKLLWLNRKSSYKIAGHECGAHGDRGPGGKKNIGLDALESGYTSCVVGHAHQPAIQRGVWRVGTTSILDPSYTDGSPNGWLHASCLIYANGSRQMVIAVDGHVRKMPEFNKTTDETVK